jgi:hypothetical protein
MILQVNTPVKVSRLGETEKRHLESIGWNLPYVPKIHWWGSRASKAKYAHKWYVTPAVRGFSVGIGF